MVWTVDWEDGFVVGGDGNRKLTPNFRLREFRRADGGVRVHRELVSALQLLRNRFGRVIAVRDVDGDGLGGRISGNPVDSLLRAADALEGHRLFTAADLDGGGVRVRIPAPDRLPEIGLEQALETAFSVTSAFETSGDKFLQVTGNFDGAGLSFGPAQVNFKTGTLVPLFRAFRQTDDAALRACFDDPADWEEWLRVLDLPVAEQIAWADGISTGRRKASVIQPWRNYLQAVGRIERFRVILVERILRDYGAKLLRAVKQLKELSPGVCIDHLRCMCAPYDLVIQQGSLDQALAEIAARIEAQPPADQFELVAIAVEERGRRAHPDWRDDCISRRLGTLNGVPWSVGDSQRTNLNYYMLRDVCIADAEELISSTDVGDQLAQASRALATGSSLLA